MQTFPEVERGEWFDTERARYMLGNAMEEFLDRVQTKVLDRKIAADPRWNKAGAVRR